MHSRLLLIFHLCHKKAQVYISSPNNSKLRGIFCVKVMQAIKCFISHCFHRYFYMSFCHFRCALILYYFIVCYGCWYEDRVRGCQWMAGEGGGGGGWMEGSSIIFEVLSECHWEDCIMRLQCRPFNNYEMIIYDWAGK